MAKQNHRGAGIIAEKIGAAQAGDSAALYELGLIYSTGTDGVEVDLIEAHKWFNLAALNGHGPSQTCRAEIALEMTAREIAEAQREARSWLTAGVSHAA